MELIVGMNCYFDLDEANKLINNLCGRDIKLKEVWNNMNNEEKEELIYSTTLCYDDCFKYKGRKVNQEQRLQFPRLYVNGRIIECPEKIKTGLLIQGLREYKENNTPMNDLLEKGVTSYKVEGTSVTFDKSQASIKKLSDNTYEDLYRLYFKEYTITI